MKNKLTFEWGVIPGREVGTITKRFHKTRDCCPEERAIAKSHGIPAKEARRLLIFAQQSNARKDTAKKEADCIKLEVARQERMHKASVKAQSATQERLARVAAYIETMEK